MRLFVPGSEGNVSVKWLHKIKLQKTPAYSREETSRAGSISTGAVLNILIVPAYKSELLQLALGHRYDYFLQGGGDGRFTAQWAGE
jgi:sulfane dehydrogenase subunit SoxC